jgi:thiamine kinase-like enzyme
MIPTEKRDAVEKGLSAAFGVTAYEDIREVTGGHTSSLVYRIVVGGSPYLLKIIMRSEDPSNHFTCMKAAAGAGLAPRVRYASVEDRLLITDFVDTVAFTPAEALARMPQLLRRLHSLPPFPVQPFNTTCTFLMNKGPMLDGFLQRFQADSFIYKAESEQLFAWLAELSASYSVRDEDRVSSHNDLFKPDNILFDGRQVLLVDWEAAFLNDRYADLAVVANLVATNEAEERLYLHEYFGQPPDAYQLARFFLMKQLAHMFYTMAFLFLGAPAGLADFAHDVPSFHALRRRMWAREVDLSDKQVKAIYGRVHWNQLVENMRGPRFQDALKIVSDRHATA